MIFCQKYPYNFELGLYRVSKLGRFLKHSVASLLWGSTVGYPSESLASCFSRDFTQTTDGCKPGYV